MGAWDPPIYPGEQKEQREQGDKNWKWAPGITQYTPGSRGIRIYGWVCGRLRSPKPLLLLLPLLLGVYWGNPAAHPAAKS